MAKIQDKSLQDFLEDLLRDTIGSFEDSTEKFDPKWIEDIVKDKR
jgi:hypothetical protein